MNKNISYFVNGVEMKTFEASVETKTDYYLPYVTLELEDDSLEQVKELAGKDLHLVIDDVKHFGKWEIKGEKATFFKKYPIDKEGAM